VNADETDPLIGRVVDSRYRVDERVARGGMATVYRATDTRLDRTVALKVMRPSFAEDPDFVARFTREARAAARLANPHIVKVFDQGQDGNVIYLAMEYVPSRTLRDVIHERGRLPVDDALAVIDPVLVALAAAHSESVVHRDVKPENVLIADDGHVYVTDFGLARATSSTATQHKTSGLLLGTVAYLSPEQVQPGVSDERSDVYAAGIVLYEMLTGAPPFTGNEAISVAYRHVNEDVPAPSRTVPEVGPELDRAVLAATRRDPSQRPADAAALLQLVRQVPKSSTVIDLQQTMVVPVGVGAAAAAPRHDTAVGIGTSVAPAGPPAGSASTSTAVDDQPPSADPQLHRRRSRRRGFVALALVLVLAVAAGAFAWWLGSGRYTTVPRVTGLSSEAAEARLQEEGLDVAYGDEQFSEIVKAGDVIASDPEQGADIREGGTVTLILSKGPERYDVPQVVGKTLDQAKQALEDRNLKVGDVERQYSDTVKEGRVVKATPKEGQSVPPDTRVDLVVSKGLPPVDVPNLVGQSQADARATLADRGLDYVVSDKKRSTQYAAGQIISQSPSPGTSVAQGTSVSVVVSTGPPLVEVPDVVQKPVDVAIQILEDAGFSVSTYDVFGVSPLNRVARQDPEAGSTAPLGSVIRLGLV
jgi:beta-lactam-binding protein with PASTA domain